LKRISKRNISEMIHIKEQKNDLNLFFLMKNTELLDNSYFNILDDIREHKWSVLNRLIFTFFFDLLLFDLYITLVNFQIFNFQVISRATVSIFNYLTLIEDL